MKRLIPLNRLVLQRSWKNIYTRKRYSDTIGPPIRGCVDEHGQYESFIVDGTIFYRNPEIYYCGIWYSKKLGNIDDPSRMYKLIIK